MAEFGECILYLQLRGNIGDKRAAKMNLEPRFLRAVFLGLSDNSDEVVVWGPEGIRKARTIKRKATFKERWGNLII